MWDAAGRLTAESCAFCMMFGGVDRCSGVASVKLCYVMFGLQRNPRRLLQTAFK